VYGPVWQPHPDLVGADWRPYTRGHWLYTSAGWTWISEFEDWGWAAFHFGRFALSPVAGWPERHGAAEGGGLVKLSGDPEEGRGPLADTETIAPRDKYRPGWVWVPDIQWSPASVAWREGERLFGWAAVPPGYSIAEDVYHGTAPRIDRDAWVFVEKQLFAAPDLARHLRPARQRDLLLRLTSRIRQWKEVGGQIVYAGPHLATFEEELGMRVVLTGFDTVAAAFGTRVLPEYYPEENLALPPGADVSEVRHDVDRRVTIAGPNSPKELGPRKIARVYVPGEAPPSGEESKKPAPRTTPTRRTPTPPPKKN
jgi:hypothetical protein